MVDISEFSYSAISGFESCAKSFEYRYIKKIPEAFTSVEAWMGGRVHMAIEWAYQQRIDGEEADLAGVENRYQEAWQESDQQQVKVIKAEKSMDDYRNQGLSMLVSFFNRIYRNDSSVSLQLEHKFDIPLKEGIRYRGVIDRVARLDDGSLRIIDFKTGRVGHPLDNLQLPSYALYIFSHIMEDSIQLAYEDLNQQRSVVVAFKREEIMPVRRQLLEKIARIRDTKKFHANPSVLCNWCGFNPICPAASVRNGGGTERSAEFTQACPLCGGEMILRKGKYGSFLGCTNFPDCSYTFDLASPADGPGSAGLHADISKLPGEKICPECGSPLKQRKGRFGEFIGCTRYPGCRYTRDKW